jgi:hypothetical protein
MGIVLYIFLATMLHIQCLLPTCSTIFVFVTNYFTATFLGNLQGTSKFQRYIQLLW